MSQDLANILRWDPWHGGDPGPEIWQIIRELDRVQQIRAAEAILNTRIAMAESQLKGLQTIKGIVAKAE